MKQAPINISMILVITYILVAIAGGIWAVILLAFGVNGFWGLFWAAFLTIPFADMIRALLVGTATKLEGISERPPAAFPFVVKLVLAAAVSGGIAYLFNQSTFYTFGFLLGSVAALVAALVLSMIYFVKVSFFTK